MSTYKGIFGKTIKHLSSDPDNLTYEGQIWYNTTEGKFKTVLATAAWSSGANLIQQRTSVTGAGIQTAALTFGGRNNGPAVNNTEEYNGSGWIAGGNLGTARHSLGGCGLQTAALGAGGYTEPGYTANSEEYNGSTWTAGGTMSNARFGLGLAGIQTSAVAAGGRIPPSGSYTNVTEEYDGSSWTSGGAMNTSRFMQDGMTGSQTAAVVFGGETSLTTRTANVEEYDGSSWTEVNNLPTINRLGGAAGPQTSALYFGGLNPPGRTTNSFTYDGTDFTASASLGTANNSMASAANASNNSTGLGSGGYGAAGYLSISEEYNFTANTITAAAWSSGTAAPVGTSAQSMAGNQTDAMMWGGDTGGSPPTWPTTSHSYNGSAWTAEGAIPIAKNNTGQAGAGHTDATMWGGYTPPAGEALKTFEYNGSAWTAGGDLNDSRQYAYNTGGGTQTSAIAIGGGPNSAEHENYNGTSWSEETDFPSGANWVGTIGSQTATLAVSGANGTTATWDGSSWTAVPATLNTNRQYGAAGGADSSEGYVFGGGPPTVRTQTELYNGTIWVTQPNMANGRNSAGGSGIQSNGLIAGSFYPSNTAVEEFTGETTALNIESVDNS